MSEDGEPQPGPSSSRSTRGAEARGAEADALTLAEVLNAPENRGASLVVPLTWCPHCEDAEEGARILTEEPPSLDKPCQVCDHVGENWVCLECGFVACSRYVEEHMVFHAAESGHRVCLSFSDLSVWCYGCDDYLDCTSLRPAQNALHRRKFGVDMPERVQPKAAAATLELQ